MNTSHELSVYRQPGESSLEASERFHNLLTGMGKHTIATVVHGKPFDGGYYIERRTALEVYDQENMDMLPKDFYLQEVTGDDTNPTFSLAIAIPFNRAQRLPLESGQMGFIFNAAGFQDPRLSNRKNERWAVKNRIQVREFEVPKAPLPSELVDEAILVG